jgi:hypothetical protein
MQHIPLSQGQVAVVDDADHPALAGFRWSYRTERDGRQGDAVRHVKVAGKDRLGYLRREIMRPGPGQEVIFLNHDRLDCRRENLKAVSKEDARRHHRVRRDCKSGVKGVRYNAETDSWSANVYRYGRCYHVGTYTWQEAAVAPQTHSNESGGRRCVEPLSLPPRPTRMSLEADPGVWNRPRCVEPLSLPPRPTRMSLEADPGVQGRLRRAWRSGRDQASQGAAGPGRRPRPGGQGSANVYRYGRCYHVGTYTWQEAAVAPQTHSNESGGRPRCPGEAEAGIPPISSNTTDPG